MKLYITILTIISSFVLQAQDNGIWVEPIPFVQDMELKTVIVYAPLVPDSLKKESWDSKNCKDQLTCYYNDILYINTEWISSNDDTIPNSNIWAQWTVDSNGKIINVEFINQDGAKDKYAKFENQLKLIKNNLERSPQLIAGTNGQKENIPTIHSLSIDLNRIKTK